MAPIATLPDCTTTDATTKVNNMPGAIPRLSDYGISRENGFLPDTAPLRRLPDPYYAQWEQVVENLQALILTQRLRGVIDKLPVLGTDGLIEESEWRRAYLLMGFMAHGYIWNGDKPADVSIYDFRFSIFSTNENDSAFHHQSPYHISRSPSTLTSHRLRPTPLFACGTGRS